MQNPFPALFPPIPGCRGAPESGTHRARHRTAAAAGARARSYSRTRPRAAPAPAPAPALPPGPRGSRGSRCPLGSCSARGKGSGGAALSRPRWDARGCSPEDAVLLSRGCDAPLPRMRCCSPGDAVFLSRGCSRRCWPPPNRPDTGPCYLWPRRPAPAPPSRTSSAHLLVTSSQKKLNRRSGSGNVNRPKLPQNQLFLRGSGADFPSVLSRSSKFASSWDLKTSPAILFWASKQGCAALKLRLHSQPPIFPGTCGHFPEVPSLFAGWTELHSWKGNLSMLRL